MFTLATKFVPVRPAFETALRAGFQAAEFWLDGSLLSQTDEIASLAREFPLRYALHFPNHGPLSIEALRSAVNLHRRLQSTAMIIHQPMFDRFGAALLEMDSEIDLAIENHILDLEGFDRWADVNPGLTLDVEHLWKFTLHDSSLAKLLEQVERFLQAHSAKLQHVHLPGYFPGGEEHHPIHHSPEMAAEILLRLADHGFKKLVVSEADLPFQTEPILQQDTLWFNRWQGANSDRCS